MAQHCDTVPTPPSPPGAELHQPAGGGEEAAPQRGEGGGEPWHGGGGKSSNSLDRMSISPTE